MNIFETAEEFVARLDLPHCGFHRALRRALKTPHPMEREFERDRTYSMDAFYRLTGPRYKFAHYYAYAIPNRAAIDALVRLGPILELGAGTGYWARLITEAGGDVIAIDECPPPRPYGTGRGSIRRKKHFDVRSGNAFSAAQYPDRALFLCWPSIHGSLDARAIYSHRHAGGTTVAVIGEDRACTGSPLGADMLERHYEIVDEVAIPQYPGIHDYLTIHRRKDSTHATRAHQ